MEKSIPERLLSLLLVFVMTLTCLITAMPLEAKAASEYITDIDVTPSTQSIQVSFHFGRDITQTDSARLAVWLYRQNGTLLTYYDFDLFYYYDKFGDTIGNYSHTFKGMSPNTSYSLKITAFDPGWSGSSGFINVQTPAVSDPVVSLDLGCLTARSVRLKGNIDSTGTGNNTYSADQLLAYGLMIQPRSNDPSGNLILHDPNAKIDIYELWRDNSVFSENYHTYDGLEPDVEYVAQAFLTNIDGHTGYSAKVYFKTFDYPQILISEITERSYDAYIYADITLDAGDSLSSLGLYADDSDDQKPKDDPARIAGSFVRYDDDTGTAVFHLTGLSADTAYDVQVFTRSGAGEKWGEPKSTFTTLPAPERATVETKNATSVRNTKAMMNATITDMHYSYVLEQGFVYSETEHNPTRSFGDPEITEVLAPITSQTAPSAFAGLADGLTPGTTYYYQSFVRNNEGTSYGGVSTFTTQDNPEVDTLSGTTDKTTSSITLYGEVLSTGGIEPTLRGIVYTRLPITPALGADGSKFVLDDEVSGDATGQFDVTLTALSAGTSYTYRAFIHSQNGTIYGDELTFTTASAATVLPAVTANAIPEPAIGETSAEVSGSFITPEGTTVTETGFVYSLYSDPVFGDPDTYYIPLTDTLSLDGTFGTTLSGLSSNTTYYVRAYAINGNGCGYSGNVSFTTKGELSIFPPAVVSSLTADSVTANSVTVTITTTGATALGRDIFYSATNILPSAGGTDVLSVSYAFTDDATKTITGLAPNTTYYLRGRATALGGIQRYGTVLTVTTGASGLPVVTNGTPPSENITFDSAAVCATAAPSGAPVTKTAVVYSSFTDTPTMGAVGTYTVQNTVSYSVGTEFELTLSGLNSGTTYYYAVYAYNAEGWSSAPVQSFTTPAAQEPVAAVTNVAAGSASASVTVRLTQGGEGDKAAYGLGVLIASVNDPTFTTPGRLIYWSSGSVGDPFTADFTGLDPSTQYYARPFVSTVDDGNCLGESYPFMTEDPLLAAVELYDPDNVTGTSAEFTVSVISGGGNPITERGIVYNTSGSPDLSNDKIVCAGAGTDPGQSAAQLTGLTEGTKYYVRAYATTVTGTAYSDTLVFTPGDTTVPPAAGNYMVSVGYNHTVALRDDGTVWCWGLGTAGQLGNGSAADSLTPVQVSGLADVKYVAAGYDCSFAVKDDGTVWAWGYNQNGELGIGTTVNSSVPVQMTGLSNITAVSASHGLVNGSERAGFALALTDGGAVYAWGANNNKQVENSATASLSSPVQITALSEITQISAGYSTGMALKSDGTVWIWGYDWTMSGAGNAVRQVATLGTDNVRISASCQMLALKSDGTVWSFGNNQYGQCGHDVGTNFVAPAAMTGVTDIADIETGLYVTVLRKTDGSVWSVGYNLSGEFGAGTYFMPPEAPNSTTLTESLIRSLIPAGTNIIQTSVVENTVSHVLDDGSIWMNGSNINGKIANGAVGVGDSVIIVHTPFMIPTINLLTGVSASTHTITFDPNGGTCGTATASTDSTGKLSSLPTATRSGYSFNGWYTAATGGTQITTSTVFSADTTVYAHWISAGTSGGSGGEGIVQYSITVSSGQGGSISPSGSVSVTKGQDATFTIKADAGYIISDVLVDGKSIGATQSYTFENMEGNHTISAVFKEVIAFIDVTETDWFYDAVSDVTQRGIMKGTADGMFSPDLFSSRAMLVTMLYRLDHEPDVSGSDFSDVPDGMWYSDAVRWAAENGIASGYGGGLFAPDDNITREQMVAILYHYATYKGYDTTGTNDLSSFSDMEQISDWALTAMRWAVGSGLILGKDEGLLDPCGTSSRAEIAALMMRFCQMYL